MRTTTLLAGVAALAICGAARAQEPSAGAPASPSAPARAAEPLPGQAPAGTADVAEVVVTAQRLDSARQAIQPSLGATTYTITKQSIANLPGADNQNLSNIVLQLPGVVQDGGGQLHVRGDHNDLQYRLNGIILPEGIAVFGQTLSPRLVGKLDLITGAMPAQYGLRTAGVIDITTRSGLFDNGGEISGYGGAHGLIQPSVEYGASVSGTNVFFSGDYIWNNLGIESVDGSSTPLHDRTEQGHAFLYADRDVTQDDRLSLIAGYSSESFQIPNPRGLHPQNGYVVDGQSDFLSDDLNERQHEATVFGIGSWLHDKDKLTLQTSLFSRYSTLTYRPDVLGELLFNGEAQYAAKSDAAVGLQSEAVYRIASAHTLRAGVIIQADHAISHTTTEVFPNDADGNVIGDADPLTISDDGGKVQWTESVYAQDEWKLAYNLTLNYGLRFDAYQGYTSGKQFSPRVNLVWEAGADTTLHAGYARYFTPPPFELVASQSLSKFVGTSALPGTAPGDAVPLNDAPKADRQNYFDTGIEQKFGAFTLGLDSYYRTDSNLLDEGQFGAPIILTPFNYKYGRIYGAETSLTYARGPFSAYANLAYGKAQGKQITSSQFSFDAVDLAYIADHYIYLDHNQTWTASAGASYLFPSKTRIGFDLIYGSGLRSDGDVPNGDHLPGYVQVNLSLSQKLKLPGAGDLEARVDVTNAFDHVYEIRDGSGIGVGAPEYGPRRGVFFGLSKSF